MEELKKNRFILQITLKHSPPNWLKLTNKRLGQIEDKDVKC